MKSFTSVFKSPTKYNNVTVTFVTTQGEITFFLYPEAAPLTVANFINLAKRGFYDNTKFTRSVDNFIVQGGDPTGTGMGGPGYTIPDEFVEWLDFYQPGMLAMANAGPNTGGSQFFFTFAPADWLNGVHTVFGEVRSEGDFQKIRKLEMGDVVKEVKISENGDFILSLFKDQVEQWNSVLDKEYPNLRKVAIKDPDPKDVEAYKEELEKLYTKKQKEVIDNHAKEALMMASILFAAGAFIGIMQKSEMITAMSNFLVESIPETLGRYLPTITGVLSMPASLLFDPDSFYFGILPILSNTAAQFNIPAYAVGRAAILGQMTTGFPVSPLTGSTFLLIGLTGVELGEHQKKTIPYAFLATIVMLIVAIITGALYR